jgi:outer membrane protein TolC
MATEEDDRILQQAAHIGAIRQAEANVEKAKRQLEQAENTLKEVKKARDTHAAKK